MTRDQNDDVQVLRRTLTVPADRDFPAGRQQQREEHLMSSWLEMARQQGKDRRRRLAVRVAAAVAVVAAVAGIAVTIGQAPGTSAGHGTTAQHTAPGAGYFPERITAVAYTLDREPHGVVKVTIRDTGETRPALERLQRDLARMGVRARVYQGDPYCPVNEEKNTSGDDDIALKVVRFTHEDGKFIGSIHPEKIPADHSLVIVFPVIGDDGVYHDDLAFDVIEGDGPDCWHMPSPGALAEDHVVGEDGRMRWVPPTDEAKR
ncbi:hypothetical protein [Streptomyces sp. V1I1]|uniref:hypothetical protein n=1 Tax=Streptomyces sp. V1I1 TaxID=3042272 RepID=UPI002782343F|nr:hypothetical protein [Streptomyces sp. V1I1]MDQ0943801.1 hypothetical protein [Streptomyces sp. V1I1]